MKELIFKIHKQDTDSLGAIRCITGLQAAEDRDMIWVRGLYESTDHDSKVKQLPIKNTYTLDEQHHLFLPGGLTPVEVLPQLNWQPLDSFIKVTLPVSAMPGKTNQSIPVQLIASDKTREGAALLTSLPAWKNYAATAPATRLNPLQFAVSANNEVLITGYPLPPLPGEEYWLTHDILLPGGFDFSLQMTAIFIQQRFNANGDSLLLFDKNGQWQKISKSFLVPAKRSAVSMTQEITANE